MAAPFAIHVTAPTAAAAPWVCVLRASDQPDHVLSLRRLETRSALTLDEVTIPVLAADLLRAGWTSLAAAHEPVLVGNQLYRGFVLERVTTLGAAAGETWRLDVLAAVGLEHPWNWPATHRLLDDFAALVRGVELSHA